MKNIVLIVIMLMSSVGFAAKTRCKFSIPCDEFTDNKNGLCERHTCHSYGCNRVVQTKGANKQKFVGKYCTKHACARVIPTCKAAGFIDAMKTEATINNNLIEVIYCDEERLVGSQCCKKHTCSFKNCNSKAYESWILESGRRVFRMSMGNSLFQIREFDNWTLRSLETCMSHSNTCITEDNVKTNPLTEGEAKRKAEDERIAKQSK